MKPLTAKQRAVLKAVYRGWLLGFGTSGEQLVTALQEGAAEAVPVQGAHRTAASLVRRGLLSRYKAPHRRVNYSITALGHQALIAEHRERSKS